MTRPVVGVALAILSDQSRIWGEEVKFMLKMLLMASAVAFAVTASGNMSLAQSEEEKAKSCDRESAL